MMKMNNERLDSLIKYLNILSQLNGRYHDEIRVAIAAIESELGIKTVEQKKEILSNNR